MAPVGIERVLPGKPNERLDVPAVRDRLVRVRAGWIAIVLLAFAFVPLPGAAQPFPVLHIIALSQRADRATVEPGGVFHVTIHVRITEPRDRLDELILGTFENCEIISNETDRSVVTGGTDFVERLTMQALAPGVATISPAYIDAVDPTLRRPMRYSSNAIRVDVTGAAAPSPAPPIGDTVGDALGTVRSIAGRLALAVAIVASIFAAGFVVFTLFVRRRRRPAPIPVAPAAVSSPAAAPAPAPISDRLTRAAETYRRERSQPAIMAVRGILFELAGVSPGATLVDALGTLGDRDPALREALLAAESAAFGPALERVRSADAMLAAIAVYTQRQAPGTADAWTR